MFEKGMDLRILRLGAECLTNPAARGIILNRRLDGAVQQLRLLQRDVRPWVDNQRQDLLVFALLRAIHSSEATGTGHLMATTSFAIVLKTGNRP